MDWTLHLGDLLTVIAMGGSVMYFAYRTGSLVESIDSMEENIQQLEKAMESVATLLTRVAVQDERITYLDKRVEDLRRDFNEVLTHLRRP